MSQENFEVDRPQDETFPGHLFFDEEDGADPDDDNVSIEGDATGGGIDQDQNNPNGG